MNNQLLKRALAFITILSMALSLLSGCSNVGENKAQSSNDRIETTMTSSDIAQIVESTVSEIINNMTEVDTDNRDVDNASLLSTDWEHYIGDLETFVYGLLINELEYKYNVFPASIDLSDGTSVYGIAYTDYSQCYTNDDESEYCLEAGFLSFCGERTIPQEDFDSGLSIHDLDYSDSSAGFVLAYGSDAFTEHCIVYGKYLKYGVDENGQIFYEAKDYKREECDTSLGSLYSYDESRYVYDIDVGEYVSVSGMSLHSQIDYEELETEINRILASQDTNMVSVEIETCAYLAQEAVSTYLLSLQEETFLGYSVSELVSAAQALDPMECYRLTKDGLITLDYKHDGGASSLTKWLVGTGCVIVTAVAFVGSIVFIECPPLSALASAMAGTAIEIFMQVVISGETLGNVQWEKVALAAATGAVSGFLGPYVYATTSGFGYFLADSTIDGLLGGIERAVFAWMDGEDGKEIAKSFGYGFALGFGLSAGFKAVGAVVGKVASKIAPGIKKAAEKVFPKLTSKISALAKSVGSAIYGLKKLADSSIFHSKYISDKLALKQLAKLLTNGDEMLAKKAFDNLSKSDIVDANGNLISKDKLMDLFDVAEDGAVLGYFKKNNEMVQIVKKNGMVGIVFDSAKYQTVTLPKVLVSDRGINYAEAAKILKEQWLNNPALIPESIAAAIKNKGMSLEDLMPEDLVSIIQKSDWVVHENIDMKSITLVPRNIHEEISHMGGVGLAKFLKSHMGFEFFERFVSAAATGVVIATE